MSWEILAPFLAFIITIGAMQVALLVARGIRSRDYRRFEDQSRDYLSNSFPIPAVDPSPAEERLKSLSSSLGVVHQRANRDQTSYHNEVVRSATCLALACSALAASTFPPEFWPLQVINWPVTELILSWIEVVALLFVLALFRRGYTSQQPWIKSRVEAELLRQFQILNMVFPNTAAAPLTASLQERFDYEANLVKSLMRDEPIENTVAKIEGFWIARRERILGATLTQADLTVDALLAYLRRRARRQLGWFIDSKFRLEHLAARRTIALISLYCIASLLAIGKHIFIILGIRASTCFVPPLLIAAGMSAAMTAYYINQNSRSLVHRYNTQQRIAHRWLLTFGNRWKSNELPPTLDQTIKNEIRAEILRFEDLMIEELVDWVFITTRDTMELAP